MEAAWCTKLIIQDHAKKHGPFPGRAQINMRRQEHGFHNGIPKKAEIPADA